MRGNQLFTHLFSKQGSLCRSLARPPHRRLHDPSAQPQTRLQQEHERSQHYLDPATRRPLVTEAEKQLVSAHLPTLLAQSSFAALVDAQVWLLCGVSGGAEACIPCSCSFLQQPLDFHICQPLDPTPSPSLPTPHMHTSSPQPPPHPNRSARVIWGACSDWQRASTDWRRSGQHGGSTYRPVAPRS